MKNEYIRFGFNHEQSDVHDYHRLKEVIRYGLYRSDLASHIDKVEDIAVISSAERYAGFIDFGSDASIVLDQKLGYLFYSINKCIYEGDFISLVEELSIEMARNALLKGDTSSAYSLAIFVYYVKGMESALGENNYFNIFLKNEIDYHELQIDGLNQDTITFQQEIFIAAHEIFHYIYRDDPDRKDEIAKNIVENANEKQIFYYEQWAFPKEIYGYEFPEVTKTETCWRSVPDFELEMLEEVACDMEGFITLTMGQSDPDTFDEYTLGLIVLTLYDYLETYYRVKKRVDDDDKYDVIIDGITNRKYVLSAYLRMATDISNPELRNSGAIKMDERLYFGSTRSKWKNHYENLEALLFKTIGNIEIFAKIFYDQEYSEQAFILFCNEKNINAILGLKDDSGIHFADVLSEVHDSKLTEEQLASIGIASTSAFVESFLELLKPIFSHGEPEDHD